jgi:endo-1,4-beta-xylanase
MSLGTAVNPVYLSEEAYTSTLTREFNMIEPEDAMKWTAIRPDKKAFDFESADRLVDFAQAHNMKIHGHNLIWGIHNPKWLADGHFSSQTVGRPAARARPALGWEISRKGLRLGRRQRGLR